MPGATVSFTEVDTYRRCAKRWEYRYKFGLKRKRKAMRLYKGEILHEMLNAHIKGRMMRGKYTGPDPWDVLDEYEEKYGTYFEEEREEYGVDLVSDCGAIFEGYLRKWRKDPLRYEASEENVYFDLPGKLPRFVGFIDKIALDEQDRRWIMDHKFVERIPTAEDRFAELQLLLYVWAWNQTHRDTPIDGIMWDYARSKAPRVPEPLKSGKGLSKAKNIDTDVYTYQKAIADNNFNPNDYADILKHLEGKEDTFYERVPLPAPSAAMIDEVTQDFLQSSAEIQMKKGKGNLNRCARTMNPFNCNTCEFRPVCEAHVRQLDANFIIKSDYTQREIEDNV